MCLTKIENFQILLNTIGLYHPLDGITNLKYMLLCFLTPNKFFIQKKALAFNRDICCHLVLCLQLILFHQQQISSHNQAIYWVKELHSINHYITSLKSQNENICIPQTVQLILATRKKKSFILYRQERQKKIEKIGSDAANYFWRETVIFFRIKTSGVLGGHDYWHNDTQHYNKKQWHIAL